MEFFSKVRLFFQSNKGIKDIFSKLSKRSTLKICVENQQFFILNKNNFPEISIYNNEDVDMEIKMPQEFVDEVIDLNPQTGKDLIVKSAEIYEKLFEQSDEEIFKFKIKTGMLKFVSRGYFKILTIGGSDLTKILKKHGIASISSLKTMLKQFMQ